MADPLSVEIENNLSRGSLKQFRIAVDLPEHPVHFGLRNSECMCNLGLRESACARIAAGTQPIDSIELALGVHSRKLVLDSQHHGHHLCSIRNV